MRVQTPTPGTPAPSAPSTALTSVFALVLLASLALGAFFAATTAFPTAVTRLLLGSAPASRVRTFAFLGTSTVRPAIGAPAARRVRQVLCALTHHAASLPP